jgi:hypothetical protein
VSFVEVEGLVRIEKDGPEVVEEGNELKAKSRVQHKGRSCKRNGDGVICTIKNDQVYAPCYQRL